MEVVVVDTTVMEKAVAHPTDARLCLQVHAAMLRVAKAEGITLRQSYRDVVAEAFLKHGRHMKARQFGRAEKQRKRLKTCAGAVLRDLERKLSEEAYARHKGTLIQAELILTNPKGGSGKFYSMHAPEVECIAKGKAHKRYEFGVKTSLAVTAKRGFVVGAMACPGNPYDGHTLNRQVVQVRKLTGRTPKRVHVDRGYKGHGGSRKAVPCGDCREQARHRSEVEAGDAAAERDRARDRPPESRREAGAVPPERHEGRRDPCPSLRDRRQPAEDPGQASALPVRTSSLLAEHLVPGGFDPKLHPEFAPRGRLRPDGGP
jgi:IS5 family transposase